VYNWVKYDKFPTYTPAWDIIYDIPDPFFGNQKVNKVWIDELEVAPGMTYGPNWSEIDSAFQEVAADMLSGKISVSNALAKAKKVAESLIR